MALSQKKRFSLFGSPPMSPIMSPTKSSTLLSNYFSSQEKNEDRLPNADEVRKAVENLGRLVAAADAYRDLLNKLSKASKTFSKTLKDYGNSKGMENVHVMCFQTTSLFYDNHTEVQSKLNKALQKDFDSIQKYWDKYSKKVTKDEKAHNDYVGDLDKQLKKMNKDFEKKAKKDNKASVESQSQYMASITALGSDIARAQKDHTEKVAKREKKTHSVISQIVCKLAEGQFAYFNESLKKCGPTITKMKEWAPFAGEDMPPPQDLDVFLDDQDSQSQSDRNSTISERKTVSIASISERQVAAMNFSQTSLNEEPENIIPTKYMQMPEPKFPVITIPETTKLTYAPRSLILDDNSKNGDTNNSSPTSSISSTPIVQPTPTSYVYDASPALPSQPFDKKSLDFSKFSIGIRDEDNVFLRDEKVIEVHHPEVFIESKVEKNVSKQHFSNQSNNQEVKVNESQNVTIDVEKDNKNKENKDNNAKSKDNEKDTNVQNQNQSEKKTTFNFMSNSPFDNIIHNRNNVSDSSNTTLNDDKKNNQVSAINDKKASNNNKTTLNDKETSNSSNTTLNTSDSNNNDKKNNEASDTNNTTLNDKKNNEASDTNNTTLNDKKNNEASDTNNATLNDKKNNEASGTSNTTLNNNEKSSEEQKINEKNEAKREESKSNENNETIKLISETINRPIKYEEKEITNEKKSSIDKDNNYSLNESIDKSSSQIPLENPKFIPSGFPHKNKEASSNNLSPRSPVQVSRQYPRDDDYRNEYSRENIELYNDGIRANEMNRYTNRDMIHRDESLLYNPPVRGERMIYNDKNLNYHRTQQYVDDDYESYDYIPSRDHGSYAIRDRSPPRTSFPYSQRSYNNNNAPIPSNHGSSVREMKNRFQSINEEKRYSSPPARNIPISTSGHVSEMASKWNRLDEVIDPPHMSNSRSGGGYGYENIEDRYSEEYRNDRYIDRHDGITPVRHCNCHNCRAAVEDSIHNNLMNSNRPSSRPYNPRTDPNFPRYNR